MRIDKVVLKKWRMAEELEDLRSFDIGIMPVPDNEWAKGKCGFKAILYMACGIPVIASKNTGALEVVGDSAASFDPADQKDMADSISAVLGNRDLRLSLREKALERVKKISWKETARQTLAVYKEVYNKRKP